MPDSFVQQRFCRNCGEQARTGTAFCVSCGEALSTSQQGAGSAPQSPPNATEREGTYRAQNRDEITEAVVTFIFAERWEESKRIVEEHRGALLTDTADEELAALITSNREDEDTVDALKEHRRLLARCREKGVDAAFAEYLQPSRVTQSDRGIDAQWDQVVDAVADFVNMQPWVASKLILKQRQDLLLTDTADEILANLITSNRDDEGTVNALKEHRQLLARCREKGIDVAFAERSQKKEPFWEGVVGWLVAFVVVVLFCYVMGLLFT